MSYSYSISGYDVSANIANAIPHQFYKEGQIVYNNEAPFVASCAKVMGSSNAAYWSVTTGGNSYGFVGEGEQINTSTEFAVDNNLGASLQRGILRTAFSISQTELAQVATLNTAVAANTVVQRMRNAWLGSFSGLARGLAVNVWNGTGAATSIAGGGSVTGLYGLEYLAQQSFASGTYAGINLATYPNMKLNLLNVGGTITSALMDKGFAQVQNAAGSVLSSEYEIWCSPSTEAALKAIADVNTNPAVRFNADEEPASYMLGARGANSGRKSRISYNGVPVFPDSSMHAAGLDGYAYLVNPKDVQLDCLPYDPPGMGAVERRETAVERFGRVTNELGLPLLYQSYANLGGVWAAYASLEVQLVFKAPNRGLLFYGITTS